jgi:hypothetical protein
MAKLSRTPGTFVDKSKGEFARGHDLESVMVVEVPLSIGKGGRKSHMKKVTDTILEQQWK